MDKVNFDIIVIGAGSGGLNIASFMNRIGLKTLLIDKTDASIGGDCLNFGCVPSKALIHAARQVNSARQARQFGIKTDGRVDMAKVRGYIRQKQDIIREHENADYFREQGMTVALGFAKFAGPDAVEVAGRIYRGKKIILATGSHPRPLKLPGSEQVKIYTNETIFDIPELPEKLVVVGAGPIAMEMAQAFHYLGSRITVVHRGSSILSREDPEISGILLQKMKAEGIEFIFESEPKRFISDKELVVTQNNSQERHLQFDAVFIGLGRILNLGGLNLEAAGIDTADGKLQVDDYLRTTNKRVFAIGDIAGKHQFTHVAEMHAALVLQNFFSPWKKKLSSEKISWVTYTHPEIATFGLSQQEIQDRGLSYQTLQTSFDEDDRAVIDGYQDSQVKLFVRKGRLLGGTMAAPNAGELTQELILAMSADLPIKYLFTKIYPYPTAARINKRTVTAYFAGKLTKLNKKILRLLFVVRSL